MISKKRFKKNYFKKWFQKWFQKMLHIFNTYIFVFSRQFRKIQPKFVRYKTCKIVIKPILKIKNSILLIQEPQKVKNLSVYFFLLNYRFYFFRQVFNNWNSFGVVKKRQTRHPFLFFSIESSEKNLSANVTRSADCLLSVFSRAGFIT